MTCGLPRKRSTDSTRRPDQISSCPWSGRHSILSSLPLYSSPLANPSSFTVPFTRTTDNARSCIFNARSFAISSRVIASPIVGAQPASSATRISAAFISSLYQDRARSRSSSKLSPDRSHQCMTPTRNSTRALFSSVLVSAMNAANAICAHKARSSFLPCGSVGSFMLPPLDLPKSNACTTRELVIRFGAAI